MTTPAPDDTPLPSVEDLPRTKDGAFVSDGVTAAFESFRRNASQLSAQVRVLKAATQAKPVLAEPVGHAARMNAMRILRAAAEFADTIEREAERAASTHLTHVDEETARRQRDVVAAEERLKRERDDLESSREDLLRRARNEADELIAGAKREADELTRSVQIDVEQTLDWARVEAATILARVKEVSRQLLRATELGPGRVDEVSDAIARAAHAATSAAHGPAPSLIAPLYESVGRVREAEPEQESR